MKAINTVPRSGTHWVKSLLLGYKIPLRSYHVKPPKKARNIVSLKHRYMPSLSSDCHVGDTPDTDFIELAIKPPEEKTAKIVFLYRNPLDQAVSYYHHVYLNPGRDPSGRPACSSEFEFLKMWMPYYLRFYLSHIHWKNKFPDNVLMMPYEKLKEDPIVNLAQIISFLMGSSDMSKVAEVVSMCTIEKNQAIEKTQGKTMANDMPYFKGVSHMADGKIKKWKEYFTQDQVDEYSSALKLHGVDLNSFDGVVI